jgi:hypothetical protein
MRHLFRFLFLGSCKNLSFYMHSFVPVTEVLSDELFQLLIRLLLMRGNKSNISSSADAIQQLVYEPAEDA